MNVVDCIIYSKDRACQLDLLLRSIGDNFQSVNNVVVLYATSNHFFNQGYEKICRNLLKYNISTLILYKETNFENDVRKIISGGVLPNDISTVSPYILGLCDDDVFVKKTDCSQILKTLDANDVNAVSLKGGLNIMGNYPNRLHPLPKFIETEPFLKWEWKNYDLSFDWGYPSCMNPFIFLKSYFLDIIRGMTFNCPTNLEGGFHMRRNLVKKYMVSFRESKVVNVPVNRVQNISPNIHGNNSNSLPEFLNQQFLNGLRISTSNLYNVEMKMGNEEKEFTFEKE